MDVVAIDPFAPDRRWRAEHRPNLIAIIQPERFEVFGAFHDAAIRIGDEEDFLHGSDSGSFLWIFRVGKPLRVVIVLTFVSFDPKIGLHNRPVLVQIVARLLIEVGSEVVPEEETHGHQQECEYESVDGREDESQAPRDIPAFRHQPSRTPLYNGFPDETAKPIGPSNVVERLRILPDEQLAHH